MQHGPCAMLQCCAVMLAVSYRATFQYHDSHAAELSLST